MYTKWDISREICGWYFIRKVFLLFSRTTNQVSGAKKISLIQILFLELCALNKHLHVFIIENDCYTYLRPNYCIMWLWKLLLKKIKNQLNFLFYFFCLKIMTNINWYKCTHQGLNSCVIGKMKFKNDWSHLPSLNKLLNVWIHSLYTLWNYSCVVILLYDSGVFKSSIKFLVSYYYFNLIRTCIYTNN